MNRMLAVVLILVLAFSLLCVGALADGEEPVLSPEKDNTTVDTQPTSPQTGYGFEIAAAAVLALLCGTVALVSFKKATN